MESEKYIEEVNPGLEVEFLGIQRTHEWEESGKTASCQTLRTRLSLSIDLTRCFSQNSVIWEAVLFKLGVMKSANGYIHSNF